MRFCTFLVLSCIFLGLVLASEKAKKGSSHQQEGSGKISHSSKHEEKSGGSQAGKVQKHDVEKSKKGESVKELHKSEAAEGSGKKKTDHKSGKHESHHEDAGGAAEGGGFKEGAYKKKKNYKKGFREKYHKDEMKKSDRFFSKSDKSGDFQVFGSKNSKYKSNHYSKQKVEREKAGGSEKKQAKASKQSGGHQSSSDKAHKDAKSSQDKHSNREKWAKSGGKKGGKHYKVKSED